MCTDCGCIETTHIQIDNQPMVSDKSQHQQTHEHMEISIKDNILSKNNEIARHNQQHLRDNSIFCTNWISAPGSGKTSLLERFIQDNIHQVPIAVIEGDQQTDRDAKRIQNAGAQAIQINTGAACHLDANMIHNALHQLKPENHSFLFIENVGNMVCPTAFDLGEEFKIAIISCTEGEDKPIKYPDIILNSEVLLINKIDLLPYLKFDLELMIQYAKNIKSSLAIFPVSAITGEGLPEFYQWLQTKRDQ